MIAQLRAWPGWARPARRNATKKHSANGAVASPPVAQTARDGLLVRARRGYYADP